MSCRGPLCPLTSYLALHPWPGPLVPDLWLGVFPLGLTTSFNSCRFLPFGCDFFWLLRVTTVLIPIWPPALTSQYPPFHRGALTPETEDRHPHAVGTGVLNSTTSSLVCQQHRVLHTVGISAHCIVSKYILILSRDII